VRFKTLFLVFIIFLLACSSQDEVLSQDSGNFKVNTETPEGAFLQILSYADNNDFDSFKNSISNPLYLQKRVEELNILDLNAAAQFKESVLRKYQGLAVTITSEIKDNEAILTVSAVKNGQQKNDKLIYMIKDNSWKLNLFGFNHNPDFVGVDKLTCRDSCSPNWFDKTVNSCYCWEEEPLDMNTSNIIVQSCEDSEHPPSCYMAHARNSLNFDYCWKVPDHGRIACFSGVAGRLGDNSPCVYLWDDVDCQNV